MSSVRLICVGVFDSAVQAYGQPLFFRARGEAIRAFMDECRNPDPASGIAKHPEDYELRFLGFFDQETGEFDTPEGVDVLMRGKDVQIPPL